MPKDNRAPALQGRELDATVAEKIMGWKVLRQKGNSPWLIGLPDGRWGRVEDRPFSTEIASAFLVVEQMRERDGKYTLILESHIALDGSVRWEAKFCSEVMCASMRMKSKSPAEAIALAALDALGFSPPEGVQR